MRRHLRRPGLLLVGVLVGACAASAAVAAPFRLDTAALLGLGLLGLAVAGRRA